MKILISHFGIKDGGGFGRTFLLALNLSKLGYDATLLTTQKRKSAILYQKEIRNSVKIIAYNEIIPIKFINSGYGIISLVGKIIYSLFHKYDVVYSDTGHRPLAGWPCVVNRFVYSSKYFSEWWDLYARSYINDDGLFKKWFFQYESNSEIKNRKRADGVVVLSSYMKERAIKLGISSDKIEIVHGGADVDNIAFFDDPEVIKEKYGFKKGSIVFGFIGISDQDLEDVEPFILAINKIKNVNVEWFTTGIGFSKKAINNYKIDERYHNLGWIDYFIDPEIMSSADIFVLVKKETERNIVGWPNKLGDYFALGRPTMITPYGDIKDYIFKHPEMFLVVEHRVKSILDTIENIPSKLEYLQSQNKVIREIAEKEYSWFERTKIIANFIKMDKTNV